jgi:hypothetical protein
MPEYKEFLCLANSKKLGGNCVAGKIVDKGKVGQWIRPVSARNTGELSNRDRRYRDGSDPRIFDIIRAPFLEKQAHKYQIENYVIDDTIYWERVGRANSAQIRNCLDIVRGPLWLNNSSSYSGLNDRVLEAEATGGGSLKFVEVDDLEIRVVVEGADFNNPRTRVRANFRMNGHEYLLSITDPAMTEKYERGGVGRFTVGKAFLCVSLGEPYNGYAYKLVAAVVPIKLPREQAFLAT